MVTSKKTDNTKHWRGCGESETLREFKMIEPDGQFLKVKHRCLPYDLAIPHKRNKNIFLFVRNHRFVRNMHSRIIP